MATPKTFKIPCNFRSDLEVTGRLVAEAVGVYHTWQILRSLTGEYTIVLRMEYSDKSLQVAFSRPTLPDLYHWVRSNFFDHLLLSARDQAAIVGLDENTVARDLLEKLAEVFDNLDAPRPENR